MHAGWLKLVLNGVKLVAAWDSVAEKLRRATLASCESRQSAKQSNLGRWAVQLTDDSWPLVLFLYTPQLLWSICWHEVLRNAISAFKMAAVSI